MQLSGKQNKALLAGVIGFALLGILVISLDWRDVKGSVVASEWKPMAGALAASFLPLAVIATFVSTTQRTGVIAHYSAPGEWPELHCERPGRSSHLRKTRLAN